MDSDTLLEILVIFAGDIEVSRHWSDIAIDLLASVKMRSETGSDGLGDCEGEAHLKFLVRSFEELRLLGFSALDVDRRE